MPLLAGHSRCKRPQPVAEFRKGEKAGGKAQLGRGVSLPLRARNQGCPGAAALQGNPVAKMGFFFVLLQPRSAAASALCALESEERTGCFPLSWGTGGGRLAYDPRLRGWLGGWEKQARGGKGEGTPGRGGRGEARGTQGRRPIRRRARRGPAGAAPIHHPPRQPQAWLHCAGSGSDRCANVTSSLMLWKGMGRPAGRFPGSCWRGRARPGQWKRSAAQ